MKNGTTGFKRRMISVLLIVMMGISVMPVLSVPAFTASAATINATGKVSDSDVNLRSSASTDAKSVAVLKKNKKLTIHKEIFTKNKSTKATTRWYYVSAGKKMAT